MITGILTKDSPLRAIFPSGAVPLMSPRTLPARLGNAQEPERVYLIVVSQLSVAEKCKMAARMAEMGQGSYDEALAELAKSTEFPIRASHISGVGMPLRSFI